MNRRSFLGRVVVGLGVTLGVVGVDTAVDEAQAARRGSPGPTTSCNAPYVRDGLLCPCYCPAANSCGTSCCDLATQTCVAGICQAI